MPERRPLAELVHRSPRRARLRFQLEEDEQPLLERIGRDLAQLPEVHEARVSPLTSSVLILHHGALEPILDRVRGWADLKPLRQHAPMRRLQHALDRANAALSRPTHENAQLSNLAFVALLAATGYQAARGKFLPAGLPLLGYALRVMDWAAVREPPLPES